MNIYVYEQSEIIKSDGAMSERPSEKTNMGELDADLLFEFGEFLKNWIMFNPSSVSFGLLQLQRMSPIVSPSLQ